MTAGPGPVTREPNLLPRPRSVSIGDEVCANRPPSMHIDPFLPEQGYRITVDPDDVKITGADQTGVAYGRRTLQQLNHVYGARLPELVIEDWPDVPERGVMLDVSRDKVPTLETLKALVVRLASWKVNQLQLYMEHTFAYAGHDVVWRDASPYTADEIADLDAYCRELHVELLPNQNCLGHMERWLRHEPYRRLAISPDGWTDRLGRTRPPTTLDPDKDGSLDLVRGLLAELLPAFSSQRVHVGLDEPFELPAERMDAYLEWLRRLRAAPELEGREMLVWGDIIARHPDWLGRLPGGVTVCEWGYEASHPFDARCAELAGGGLPFFACPGTSSWNSLVGRASNARENLANAADAAVAHGGDGYLITDWGDNGHLQYLPVSEPGFAYGAAVSWCFDANVELDLATALDVHAFDDPTGELSRALLVLGDAHRLVKPQAGNASVLARPLYSPQARLADGLTAEDLREAEAAITGAVESIARSRPRRPDGDLVKAELSESAALVLLACRDARARLDGDGTIGSVPAAARSVFADTLEPLIARHRELWLSRNRPGGLDDSAARLERLLQAYR